MKRVIQRCSMTEMRMEFKLRTHALQTSTHQSPPSLFKISHKPIIMAKRLLRLTRTSLHRSVA